MRFKRKKDLVKTKIVARRSCVHLFKGTNINFGGLTKAGYKFGKKIGEGTSAYVVEAELNSMKLACKYINKDKLETVSEKRIYLPRELKALKGLQHPNIISTYDIIRDGNCYFILMERAKTDFLDYMKTTVKGPISEAESKIWFKQMVSGIQYLHEKLFYAHRDLKLENILLSFRMTVKLGDFGYIRDVRQKTTKKDFALIKSKTFCGSKAYASPEILQTVAYFPLKADIWSLGVVLSIMINGIMPFRENDPSLVEKMKASDFQVNKKIMAKISQDLRNLLFNMLNPKPSMRYNIRQVANSKWMKSNLD